MHSSQSTNRFCLSSPGESAVSLGIQITNKQMCTVLRGENGVGGLHNQGGPAWPSPGRGLQGSGTAPHSESPQGCRQHRETEGAQGVEKGAGGDPQRSCHRAKGHGEEMRFPLRTTKSRVF